MDLEPSKVFEAAESADSLSVDSFLQRIEGNKHFDSLLSCYLCFLWRRQKFEVISTLRKQFQHKEPGLSHCSALLSGIASDREVVTALLPTALSWCLEQGDEELAVDILHNAEIEISAAHVCDMAIKGMHKALQAVIDHAVMPQLEATTDLVSMLSASQSFPRKNTVWTLERIIQLLLKRNVDNEALIKVLGKCANCDEEMIILLLRHKRDYLALKLLNVPCEQRQIENSGAVLGVAIDHHCYAFILHYVRRLKGCITGDHNAFFSRVMYSMQAAYHNWPFYLYILKICVRSIPLEYGQQLIEFFAEETARDNPDSTFVLHSLNPMKTCLCIYELVWLLGKELATIESRCGLLCQDLARLAVLLSNELQTEEAAVDMYRDVDLEGRDLIRICCELGLTEMFLNKHVEKLANDVWNGSAGEFAYFFEPSSSLYALTTFDFTITDDYERKNRCGRFCQSLRPFRRQRLQYKYWKDGIHFRYLLEAVSVITFAVLLFVTVQNALGVINDFVTILTECDSPSSCAPDSPHKLAVLFRRFLEYQDMTFTLLFCTMLLFLTHFVRGVYTFLCGQKLHLDLTSLLLDLAISALSLAFLGLYFGTHLDNKAPASTDQEFVLRGIISFDGNTGTYLSVLVLLIIIRALLYFNVSPFLGPFISSIQLMIVSVWQLAVVYITFLFVFALIFMLLNVRYRLNAFFTFQQSLLTVFQSSLGVYDLNALPDSPVFKLLFVCFLLICSILLLNILIAILTQAHDTSRNKGAGIYLSAIFSIRDIYGLHPYYDFLTHSFFPFSVILCIVCLPLSLLLSPTRKVQLNNFLLRIEYGIALLLALILYAVLEVLLLPIAYCKCLLHKGFLLIKFTQQSRLRKALEFSLFLVMGPILLLGNMFLDLSHYIRHSCLDMQETVQPYNLLERGSVPYDLYNEILSFLRQDKRAKVTLKELTATMRKMVEIKPLPLLVLQDTNAVGGRGTNVSQDNGSRKQSSISNVFVLSSLLNLVSNAAIDDGQGTLEVSPKQLLSILTENMAIQELQTEVRLLAQDTKAKQFTPDKDPTEQNIEAPLPIACQSHPAISLRLPRWHNANALTKAFLGQKSLLEVILMRPTKSLHTGSAPSEVVAPVP